MTFIIEQTFKESDEILKRLNKGQPLHEILTQSSSHYFQNIARLGTIMSLKQSIRVAGQLQEQHAGLLIKLLMKNLYPAFLFVFSWFMLVFLQDSILPSMAGLVDGAAIAGLSFFRYGFGFLIAGTFILTAITVIPVSIKTTREKTLVRLSEHCRLVNVWMMSIFAHVLCILLQSGCSTGECLSLMKEMKPVAVCYPAKKLYASLMRGISLETGLQDGFFDPGFIRFFQTGMQTGDPESLLKVYVEKVNREIRMKLKRIGVYFQILSYLSVGIVVLYVVQIMLMPMNMLSAF